MTFIILNELKIYEKEKKKKKNTELNQLFYLNLYAITKNMYNIKWTTLEHLKPYKLNKTELNTN